MKDTEAFTRMLGTEVEKYTEPQLEELRRQMYGLADLLLDIYLSHQMGRNMQNIDSTRSSARLKTERSKNKSPLG